MDKHIKFAQKHATHVSGAKEGDIFNKASNLAPTDSPHPSNSSSSLSLTSPSQSP